MDIFSDRKWTPGLDQIDGGWVMNGILLNTRVFFRTIRSCFTTAMMEARNLVYKNDEE
jgi:hypothetical protein